MELIENYLGAVSEIIQKISAQERVNIQKAAELMADTIAQDRLIHVFGTGGHSYMFGEEMFYRAGGLAAVNAILDAGVSLIHGAIRATTIERTPGYAKSVLDAYKVGEGDVIIIANAFGMNSVTIDAALESKKRGAKVIAVTSPEMSKAVPAGHPARHPSNKNLYEIADVTIDMHVPPGDAVLEIEGCDQKVAPVSTIAGAFIVHSLAAYTVENLVKRGVEPPVWKSGNMPGGDEANRRFFEKYRPRVKHL